MACSALYKGRTAGCISYFLEIHSLLIFNLFLLFTFYHTHTTTEANNRNAYDLALGSYKSAMEQAAGQDKPFVKEAQLQALHDALYIASFEQFDEIATMGE